MIKIVFIGCAHFSQVSLSHISGLPNISVTGIVTSKNPKPIGDFICLEPYAKQLCIDCFLYDNNDSDLINWIKQREPDVIYCFGWPKLLRQEVFAIPRIGTVGYHPTALPKNRGRHPIIWSLALGLNSTCSTFFFINEGVDSGDILSQIDVTINDDDNATSLYEKLNRVALLQITEFTKKLDNNQYARIRQDERHATYWRKRTKNDGLIDWRMTAISINNLIRALSKPYPGASCKFKSAEFSIWKGIVVKLADNTTEPGKILSNTEDSFTVKCGEDAITIIEHEFPEIPAVGTYL